MSELVVVMNDLTGRRQTGIVESLAQNVKSAEGIGLRGVKLLVPVQHVGFGRVELSSPCSACVHVSRS